MEFLRKDDLLHVCEVTGYAVEDPQAWGLVDTQLRFIWSNPTWQTVFGYSLAKVQTMTLHDFWVSDEYKQGVLNSDKIKYRKYIDAKGQIISAKLEVKEICLPNETIYTGKILRWEYARTKYDPRESDKALVDFVERMPLLTSNLNNILDDINVGIYITAINQDFLFANKNFAAKLGFEQIELMFQKKSKELRGPFVSSMDVAVKDFVGEYSPWLLRSWRHKLGGLQWGRIKATKMQWNGITGLVHIVDWINHDVSLMASLDAQDIEDFIGKDITLKCSMETLSKLAEFYGVTTADIVAATYLLRDQGSLKIDGEGERQKPQLSLFEN